MPHPKRYNYRVNKSTILNCVFALAIVLVAGALAWVGWTTVDNAQKGAENLKRMNTTAENTKISGNRYEAVPDDVGALMMPDERDIKAEKAQLSGSELPFHRGLDELEARKWDACIADMTTVVAMIPAEARTKKQWHSDGTLADQAFFTAYTYQARAYCYAQKRLYQKAIDDLTAAIKLRPGYSGNYENRAKAYYYLGQKKQGDADTQQAQLMNETPGTSAGLK